MSALADAIVRNIARHGDVVTLRQDASAAGVNPWTSGAVTPSYFTGRGKTRGYRPSEIRGAVQEFDQLVTVAASGFAAAPKIGDRVALGTWSAGTDMQAEWLQIVNVYAARANGAVAAYKLQVRR